MPAGVSWGRYLTFTGLSMFTMFLGAQTVHSLYRPLDDINKYIEVELGKLQSENSNSPPVINESPEKSS